MQKKFISAYFIIFFTLLIMMSLSRRTADNVRGSWTNLFAPLWEQILSFKHFLSAPTRPSPFRTLSKKETIRRLETENRLLATEIDYLTGLLGEHTRLDSEIKKIAPYSTEEANHLSKNRAAALKRTLEMLEERTEAVPARVIFRSFDTWNSSLWVNAGDSHNRPGEKKIVAKNSPVVIGRSVVGVIDRVEKNRARVHLIGDGGLSPSVRASRDGEQELVLDEYVEALLQYIAQKGPVPLSVDRQTELSELLTELKKNITPLKASKYLAKGELSGCTSVSRGIGPIRLKGIGFNYDFEDEEGVARDLRSGKPLKNLDEPAIPILKVNDVLVTTGTDGIFPAGFRAGIVTRVELLKEGDYFYRLECRPAVKSLQELSLVFILPPLSEHETFTP